jgi:uncharacterized cupredoxin-like copper-binding protein
MYDARVVLSLGRSFVPRFAFCLALVALLASACGGPATPTAPPGSVTVELKDYDVVVASTTLPAGSSTFFVKNSGPSAHDLTIIKSDLPAGGLPQEAGKAKEDGRVGGTNTLNAGQAAVLTVTLQPGNYIFICNEPGHYALGMHTAVKVQ